MTDPRKGPAVRALAVSALVPAVLAAGCAQDPLLDESTWLVTAIYTEPGAPAVVPDAAAGLATMAFGESTVSGFTGCSPLQAQVSYSDAEGGRTGPGQAEHVEFTRVTVPKAPADCVGAARHVHDQLTGLLDGGFGVEHLGATEMVLRKDAEGIDPPAIRLAAS